VRCAFCFYYLSDKTRSDFLFEKLNQAGVCDLDFADIIPEAASALRKYQKQKKRGS
jgi:hypothetical protein